MKPPVANTARSWGKLVPNPKARLRDPLHEVARFKHLSHRTEETYWQWIQRFLRHHRQPAGPGSGGEAIWRHPRDLGPGEIGAFLSPLATEQHVAAATQNQALCALLCGWSLFNETSSNLLPGWVKRLGRLPMSAGQCQLGKR